MSLEANQKWKENGSVALSVVMIGHRSASLLFRALSSLLRHSPANGSWELVLILNGGFAEVEAFAAQAREKESFPLAIVRIPECRPGAARNAGVRVARGELVFFLDDDIESFQDVLGAAMELFRNPALMAAGGANLTPPGSGALARATGCVMSSWFGAASMRKRYKIMEEGVANEHSLILCNLAVRKSIFEAERGFAVHLISNEESVFLQRLEAKGALLLSSPKLAVYHYRRNTWGGLCAQAAKYGAGRAQNLLLVPESLRFFYFLPAIFVLSLLSFPLLLLVLGWGGLFPFLGYLLLAFGLSLSAAIARRDPAQLLGFLVFPCIHFFYGLGFLRALCRWIGKRKELQEHSAAGAKFSG